MKNYISESTRTSLTTLGLYQIGGAVFAFYLVFRKISNELYFDFGQIIFLLSSMLIFFGYSTYCGILCIRLKNMAIRHSYINHFLQVITFTAFGYGFEYVSGVSLNIGVHSAGAPKFKFDASSYHLTINMGNAPEIAKFAVNLIAVAIIYFIYRLNRKIKKEKSSQAILELTST